MTNIHKNDTELKPIKRSRVILSQVIACLALDLLLVDLGMAFSFATIVVPEVLNASSGLSVTESQASWFGSMAFLCQPLGSIFSGPILDFFGRKRAIFIVNLPHIIAWLMMYYAWNVPSLFIANALLGIGTGIMEAPSVTYVGEVSDVSIRGVLTTFTGVFTATGMFLSYFLGRMLPWRQAALVCLSIPLISMLLVVLVPETPIWLLSKGRNKDALKSLCRIRGWVQPEYVKDEYNQLLEYSQILHQCVICLKNNNSEEIGTCNHVNKNIFKRVYYKIRYVLLAKETLRPFMLVFAYFMFHTLSGLAAVRPNMVNFCKALGVSYDSKTLVVFVGALYIATVMVTAAIVKIIGKRKLVVGSMLATSCSSLAISIYASKTLNDSVFSYEPDTFPERTSIVPVVLFLFLVCFTSLGIPWVLLSEVFPFRSRGVATGFSAASTYMFFFISAKTNYNLESLFHISGTFAIYAFFGIAGTIYLYLFLPETENKSLVDIEDFYKGGFKIFADDPFIRLFIGKKKSSKEQSELMLPSQLNVNE